MNENMDRIKHGWFPLADAHWVWWMLADGIVLVSIVKARLKKIFQPKPL